jgi:glutamyl-tRNA synthetase
VRPPDGRYAPSPTGTLHLGNLRTALLAWLFARSQGARFLMRVEDLDSGRVREHFVEEQLDDIRALELEWDGETVRQSERTALYDEALETLRDLGLIYECFCTRAEIREASSAPHGPHVEGAYPGTCRELTAEKRAERLRAGRPPALRVRAGCESVTVVDRLCGSVTRTVDDFVVRRNDGDYAYNLAVVVDDAEQGIGEVVRGADLLDSTPRQVWLARALGLDGPSSFAHVPLMLGPDGERLAKRHGAVTLADAATEGRDAQTVRGELAASLGLAEPGESPALDLLLTRFDPTALRGG